VKTFNSKKIIYKAKRTHLKEKLLEQGEPVSSENLKIKAKQRKVKIDL
jgi:hypothetical protein